MPDYDKLLTAQMPEAIEAAFESINGAFDQPEQLLHADVRLLEELNCCTFAYFNRDDIFYVNRAGRKLLEIGMPTLEPKSPKAPPIFWLEDDDILMSTDRLVLARRIAIAGTRELVTLSWGKTWLEGIKLPILSAKGHPIAILFAGKELSPSRQIRQVAAQLQLNQTEFRLN